MQLLVDQMCGGIVSYLRMCGHDVWYALNRDLEADTDIRACAASEGRTVVTRDQTLAAAAERSILLEATDTNGQLRELAAAGVSLEPADRPPRCGRCNGRLERVPAEVSTPTYAPAADEMAVYRCRDCGQHFWKGSHWERVTRTLEEARTAGDRVDA